ncbi:hypothetical protein DFS34DRAFT_603194 [Phlyctochytrium arcticum]|nr:hypothetical protein DFS34DRAFT_603194 [Phlyctochytrium arcticum]
MSHTSAGSRYNSPRTSINSASIEQKLTSSTSTAALLPDDPLLLAFPISLPELRAARKESLYQRVVGGSAKRRTKKGPGLARAADLDQSQGSNQNQQTQSTAAPNIPTISTRDEIFNSEAAAAFARLQATYRDSYFRDVRTMEVPDVLRVGEDEEGGASSRRASHATAATVPATTKDRMRKGHVIAPVKKPVTTEHGLSDSLSVPRLHKQSSTLHASLSSLASLAGASGGGGIIGIAPDPHGGLSKRAASPHATLHRSLMALNDPTGSHLNLSSNDRISRPPSRDGSPDLPTILDRVERTLEWSLAKAEDNLFQSTDNLVKAKLTALAGSTGHIYDGGGEGGPGSRPSSRQGTRSPVPSRTSNLGMGASARSHSKLNSSSTQNLSSSRSNLLSNSRTHLSSKSNLASSSRKNSTTERLPSIHPHPHHHDAVTGGLEHAAEDPEAMGAAVVEAATRAIREGEARRRRMNGEPDPTPAPPPKNPSKTNLARTKSTTITSVTSRLTDPAQFPSSYKNKYGSSTVLNSPHTFTAGGASRKSTNNLSSSGEISKKASEVVSRLTTDTSPRTSLTKSSSKSQESFTGYPSNFKPVPEPVKQKLYHKPKIEFFTTFAPPGTSIPQLPPPAATLPVSARGSVAGLPQTRLADPEQSDESGEEEEEGETDYYYPGHVHFGTSSTLIS